MRDIAVELLEWCDAQQRIALASVIAVRGSAPRPVGAALAVDSAGNALGAVSGGCVEGAVYEKCQEVLRTGQPGIESFGYSDDDALEVGLTCGGTITVYIGVLDAGDPALRLTLRRLVAGQPVTLARVIDGPETGAAVALAGAEVVTRHRDMDPDLIAWARAASPARSGQRRHGDSTVLFEVYPARPELLIYGAIDFAACLATAGTFCGYRVTVCDARAVFTTATRFPGADEVVVEWPHRHFVDRDITGDTAVCVLTHDAKFDIPLLERALGSAAGYIGAMGSRRTHRDRITRLRQAGCEPEEIARLHSPIGLDLGGHSGPETAVSIMAEILARRNGAAAGFLSATDVPIHRQHAIS